MDMIVFDVTCARDHSFEGWYKDAATFDRLVSEGAVACPVCGDTDLKKSLSAPRLGGMRKGRDEAPPPRADREAVTMKEVMTGVRELKRHVEENSDYVGDRFPEEARKIHYGETEPQSIHGEATPEEAAELREEGVDFHRIPWPAEHDA